MNTGGRGVVVGIDGSAGSDSALEWAVARADLVGPIRPVYAWEYPAAVWLPAPFAATAVPPAIEMQAAAEEAALSCEVILADVEHDPPVVRRGAASTVLLDESADARLLVLGTRGHGPIVDALLGSVGRRCADKTSIPLVIVPHLETQPVPPLAERIVVGVDGSPHSDAALRWAIEIAGESDEIIAVSSWTTPIPIGIDVPRFDVAALRAEAQRTVDIAVEQACADTGVAPDRVIPHVAEGDPRWIFKEMEEEAGLLVLGSRGHTGFSHLVLGSTTTSLIHSPSCAVAVVP